MASHDGTPSLTKLAFITIANNDAVATDESVTTLTHCFHFTPPHADRNLEHLFLPKAQLCQQVLGHARARDARVKKRKTDIVVEDARQECREYLDR